MINWPVHIAVAVLTFAALVAAIFEHNGSSMLLAFALLISQADFVGRVLARRRRR